MKWYPWLSSIYRQIIIQHQADQAHHALLIQTLSGMGDKELVLALSRWILCQKRDGLKSCNQCRSCQLMLAGTHPDWNQIIPNKEKETFGIDAVRKINAHVFNQAQRGGAKVVWISNVEQLTESAANAILKTLEEPPPNTWFFLCSSEPFRLLPTIKSRCLKINLTAIDEENSLIWLKRQCNWSIEMIRTALRLSGGSPGAALVLLEYKNWSHRRVFCDTLFIALEKDLFVLLPQLNQEDVVFRITWLISLLIDALKWQQDIKNFLVNIDQLKLIQQLAQKLSPAVLDNLLRRWLCCRNNLIYIPAVNRELLLIEQLIGWEELLNSIV